MSDMQIFQLYLIASFMCFIPNSIFALGHLKGRRDVSKIGIIIGCLIVSIIPVMNMLHAASSILKIINRYNSKR